MNFSVHRSKAPGAPARTTGSSCPAAFAWRAICAALAVSGLGEEGRTDQGPGNHPAGGGKPAAIGRGLLRNDGQPRPAGQTNPGRTPSDQPRTCRQKRRQRLGPQQGGIPLRHDQRGRSSAHAGAAARPAAQPGLAWPSTRSIPNWSASSITPSARVGLFDRLPDQPGHRHPRQRHVAFAGAGPGRANQPDHSIRQQARPGRARPLRRRAPKPWAMFSRSPTR